MNNGVYDKLIKEIKGSNLAVPGYIFSRITSTLEGERESVPFYYKFSNLRLATLSAALVMVALVSTQQISTWEKVNVNNTYMNQVLFPSTVYSDTDYEEL